MLGTLNCLRYSIDRQQWDHLYHVPKEFAQEKVAVGCQVQKQVIVVSHHKDELNVLSTELEPITQWQLRKFKMSVQITSIRSIVHVPKLSEVIVFARGFSKSAIAVLIKLHVY